MLQQQTAGVTAPKCSRITERLRAETYLRLDILISELQKETASIHNLQGIDAVRILVSRHSALSIIEVRYLSFSELIFLLQPALESANIPPEVINTHLMLTSSYKMCHTTSVLD